MLSCYTPFLLAIVQSRASHVRRQDSPAAERDTGDAAVDPSPFCPTDLCVEALWALSEYAVLSPGLATTEVLPLAVELARDTREHPMVSTECSDVQFNFILIVLSYSSYFVVLGCVV